MPGATCPSLTHVMKRVLLILAVLVFSPVPSVAQYGPTFPGCAQCGVIGYVDLPARGGTVSNAALLSHNEAFEGWGFECVSGDPVDRVDLFVEDDVQADIWHPVKQSDDGMWGGYWWRPDVSLAFVKSCPAILGRYTGWVRWIDKPLPLGAHRFRVLLWHGPYHAQLVLTLNVIP